MALGAAFWNDFRITANSSNNRIDEAANMPFHSMHMGRREADEGSLAVSGLQSALLKIQQDNNLLLPFFRPGLIGSWGPFNISQNELDNASFGSTTDLAVKLFQKQHGFLDVDGKAGINTLRELDRILASLEFPGPSPFGL